MTNPETRSDHNTDGGRQPRQSKQPASSSGRTIAVALGGAVIGALAVIAIALPGNEPTTPTEQQADAEKSHSETQVGVTADAAMRERALREQLADMAERGFKAYQDKKYKEAHSLVAPGETKDIPLAQHVMGLMYFEGHVLDKDETVACALFQKAAESGLTVAKRKLGRCYMNGTGTTKNTAKGLALLREAIEEGSSEAMYDLGYYYFIGVGVPKDHKKAAEWTQRAVDAGETTALNNLAVFYENGHGVPKDLQKARMLYRKGADAGHHPAMQGFAWMAKEGLGGPKDLATARRYYLKSADLGNENSLDMVAWYYRNGGDLFSKNYRQALHYYKKLAALGNANAMNEVGLLYLEGLGVKQDNNEALKWFWWGAKARSEWAVNNMGVMYNRGWGVRKNLQSAHDFWRIAASMGLAEAQYNLAVLYLDNNNGFRTYPNRGVYWMKKAADQGHAQAKRDLPKAELIASINGGRIAQMAFSAMGGYDFVNDEQTKKMVDGLFEGLTALGEIDPADPVNPEAAGK